ncbi:MAG: 8-amino-7-oxononanoate synthase, partial [Deltaproteobacteria bacterium]
MNTYFAEELSKLTGAGLKRSLRLIEGPQGPRVTVDGKEAVLLCSNDYLGLANHPLVKQAAIEAINAWGLGSGASRLVSGNMEPHVRLEDGIRRFKGTEAALLFNSGYHANMGCISAVCSRDAEVFSDRLNHASIVDACVLSRAAFRRYPHRDADSLERLLKRSRAKRKLVVTDGVFSMDGDIAPIKEIAGLLDRYNAMLLIDEAHSTGVLGDKGRGTLEFFGVEHPSIMQMGTLGKAVGSFGAFIAGSVD